MLSNASASSASAAALFAGGDTRQIIEGPPTGRRSRFSREAMRDRARFTGRRLVGVADVCTKCHFGKTHLYKLMQSDPTFPRSFRISKERLWSEEAVDQWLAEREAAAA